ncbi:MAG: MotA/TolQ/ExbB proton channel family protein [Flavobacteriales bacterium]|jgi:biopolymer transport protein ExbB
MQPFLFLQTPVIRPTIDVLDILLKGGIVMVPLALLSVLALVLIIERSLFFNKNLRYKESVYREYLALMGQRDLKGASAVCTAQPNSWGRVFSYSTVGFESVQEMDKAMEEAAEVEIARLEKNLNYLSIIAGVAPLLGFIGTIVGVITIFYDISISQDISIAVISEGLYKKMVTSATGLVIGILAYSAYHLFQNQIDRFVNTIREQSLTLKVTLSGTR